MSSEESTSASESPSRSWPVRILLVLWRIIRAVGLFLIAAWTFGAIYFALLPWEWARVVLAVAFAGFAIWALCVKRTPKLRLAFAGVVLVVFVWFVSQIHKFLISLVLARVG
mgnify:CR=1 FL=1